MKTIRLDAIVFDAGTQVREAINEQVVRDYADRLAEGVEFPPVVLFHDGNRYFMADGFHRGMAHLRVGREEIAADVRHGTREDALWFALGANKANGQRMTEGDKKHAITLALTAWPDRSATQLAVHVGCSTQYVQRIRDAWVAPGGNPVKRVVGADGVSYPASKEARLSTREQAEALLRDGKSVQDVRDATGIGRDAALQIKRTMGLGVDKSRDGISARHKQMRELAAEGYTSRQIAETVGLSVDGCRNTLRALSIDVPADKAVGRSNRHDSNRIVSQIVADAENITAGADLIDFSALDRSQIAEWVTSLQASRDALGSFIRRLSKEQSHGQVA